MDKKGQVFRVPAIPVVVKKGSSLTLLKNNHPNSNLLLRCLIPKYQLIYKSVPGDFLNGEFPNLTLVSRSDATDRVSTTVARYASKNTIIEKNSNEIVKIIGQNNYDTVFSAICSVISQEIRVRALLALLTVEGRKTSYPSQKQKSYADTASQTDKPVEFTREEPPKPQKRIRKHVIPYIVQTEDENTIKKIVIDPKSLFVPSHTDKDNTQKNEVTLENTDISEEQHLTETDVQKELNQTDAATNTQEENSEETRTFPDLRHLVDEDSSFSDISNISINSQLSLNIPQLLENPNCLLSVNQGTEALNTVPLTLLDGSVIMVRAKPIDKFHWATMDILKGLSCAEQMKLMSHQAIIHWKYCLERDEDGYLPIHQAVMFNDMEFLQRQCNALKHKYGSLDIAASGNITPLQMSIYNGGERCTEMLLSCGADPCLQDDEGKSFFHTAAEVSAQHLNIALKHCRGNARSILMDDDALWTADMESQSDDELAKVLLDHIGTMCDNQGYTPLMLASKQGNYEAVKMLLEASPNTVNCPMPNSGSTSLYLAVSAACIETSRSNNQTKVSENFKKTIGKLMEAGGDPSLENYSNSSVNVLLTEFNILDLSLLVANKLTAVKYFPGKSFGPGNINMLMLYKNSNGKVDVTEIRPKKDNPKALDESTVKDYINIPSSSNVMSDANDEGNINSSKNKISKIDIKEIKTINPNLYRTVPKATTANDTPKFVRILPKLGDDAANDSLKQFVVVGNSKANVRKRTNKTKITEAAANKTGITAAKKTKEK